MAGFPAREQALLLLAAANNHGDLAVKLSSLKQAKDILLSVEPSQAAEIFPYLAELQFSPETLVRKYLLEWVFLTDKFLYSPQTLNNCELLKFVIFILSFYGPEFYELWGLFRYAQCILRVSIGELTVGCAVIFCAKNVVEVEFYV